MRTSLTTSDDRLGSRWVMERQLFSTEGLSVWYRNGRDAGSHEEKNNKPVKKATEEEGGNRVSRKEPYSSERIARIVDRLREQAGRLSSLVRSMEESELEDVIVDGHAMLLRGLNQVDNFADNTARAVREARTAKFE